MAILILWFGIYVIVEVFRGNGAAKPASTDAALALLPADETPIAVDWELLPSVEQAADRN
jgi:hypothetical protein